MAIPEISRDMAEQIISEYSKDKGEYLRHVEKNIFRENKTFANHIGQICWRLSKKAVAAEVGGLVAYDAVRRVYTSIHSTMLNVSQETARSLIPALKQASGKEDISDYCVGKITKENPELLRILTKTRCEDEALAEAHLAFGSLTYMMLSRQEEADCLTTQFRF